MCNAPSGRTRIPEPSFCPRVSGGAPDVLFLGCSVLPDSPPSPGESIPRLQTSGGRWTSHAKVDGRQSVSVPPPRLRPHAAEEQAFLAKQLVLKGLSSFSRGRRRAGGVSRPSEAARPASLRPHPCQAVAAPRARSAVRAWRRSSGKCRRLPGQVPRQGLLPPPSRTWLPEEAARVWGCSCGRELRGRARVPLVAPAGRRGGKSEAGTEGPGAAGTGGRGSSARLRSPGQAPPPPRLGILGVAVQTPEGLRCPPAFSAAAPDVLLNSFNSVALLELLKRRFCPCFPGREREKGPRDCAFPCRVTRSGGRAAPGGRSWRGPSWEEPGLTPARLGCPERTRLGWERSRANRLF